MDRDVGCGELRIEQEGNRVKLAGWVHRRRDHGGIIFLDLRDRTGLIQVVINLEQLQETRTTIEGIRNEWVLRVEGEVVPRPSGTVNSNLPTGNIEVDADTVTILNQSKTPPFYINEESPVDESLRLRHRYLYLRRQHMYENLVLRHNVVKFIRDFLSLKGFLEIETPTLIKSTPEGARDYLVPSRTSPGQFYALPQSPQQLKQLLMVAGFEKYFQIARCFRDEDMRADRQNEFTQLDLEMSFVDTDDVLELIEALYTEMIETLMPHKSLLKPFPRLSHAEAMDRFGTDKPDLRFKVELSEVTDIVRMSQFKVFADVVANGGIIKGLAAPGCSYYTRKEIDQLTEIARSSGAHGLVTFALDNEFQHIDGLTLENVRSPVTKFFSVEEVRGIAVRTKANPGDLILLIAGETKLVNRTLDVLRREVGRQLSLADPNMFAFAFVVDFPLFEWDDEQQRWDSSHHPFTAPWEEDIPLLDTEPGKIRSHAYDLVCNQHELGSGSIRIHQRGLQEKIFEVLGYTREETEERFGHLLEAFEYGAPPHGGMAPGIDRLIMVLAGEESLREVIAFPKTQSAQDLLFGAPSTVADSQLEELGLRVVKPESDSNS